MQGDVLCLKLQLLHECPPAAPHSSCDLQSHGRKVHRGCEVLESSNIATRAQAFRRPTAICLASAQPVPLLFLVNAEVHAFRRPLQEWLPLKKFASYYSEAEIELGIRRGKIETRTSAVALPHLVGVWAPAATKS